MRPLFASLLISSGACAITAAPVSPSTYLRSVSTSSEKAVSVVEDKRFEDNEPTAVSSAWLARAMLASGLFNDEDATQLSGPIAAELPEMEPREFIRITTWAEDGPRRYFLYIHDHKLHIRYFRELNELTQHESALPPLQAAAPPPPPTTPAAPPPPVEQPAPPPTQHVQATSPHVEQPAPTAAIAPATAPIAPAPATATPAARRPRSVARNTSPPPPRLSEDEARQKLRDLDRMMQQGLISATEYRQKRKEILERL